MFSPILDGGEWLPLITFLFGILCDFSTVNFPYGNTLIVLAPLSG